METDRTSGDIVAQPSWEAIGQSQPRLFTAKAAARTGACRINRPCAQQYVGKSQSCMVISRRRRGHGRWGRWLGVSPAAVGDARKGWRDRGGIGASDAKPTVTTRGDVGSGHERALGSVRCTA